MSRRRSILALVMAAVMVALGVSGCGVPDDSEPRAIPPGITDLMGPGATTVPPTTTVDDAIAPLYFLADNRLTRVERRVAVPPDTEAVLELLMDGPTENEQRRLGVTSAIPVDASLINVSTDADGVLVMELGPELGTISGVAAKVAYAQLVLTADALGFERVRFIIDGKAVDAPTDDGNRTVVRADNYDPPLNPV